MAAGITFADFLDSEAGKGLIGVGLSVICLYLLYKNMQKTQQLETRVLNLEYKTYTQDMLLKQLQDTLQNKIDGVHASFITPASGIPMTGVQTNIAMPGGMPVGPAPTQVPVNYGTQGVGSTYAFNRQKL